MLIESFNYIMSRINTTGEDAVTPSMLAEACRLTLPLEDSNMSIEKIGQYMDWVKKGANTVTAIELANTVEDEKKIFIFPTREFAL